MSRNKVKNRTISVIIDAKAVISLMIEDELLTEPAVIAVADSRAADSRTVRDKEGLQDYLRRLGENDHVTHLGSGKGEIFLDIRRGGSIKERERDIEDSKLTGHTGVHGILTLDKNGIQRFYKTKLHPEELVCEALSNDGNKEVTAASSDRIRDSRSV